MKITLTEKKEVSEDIEIQTPAFFKSDNWIHRIDENKVTHVNKTHCGIWHKDAIYYESGIRDALKGEPCSKEEYEAMLQTLITELQKS